MTQFLIRLFIRQPDHAQDPKVRAAYGNLACWVGVACNLLLCLGKLTVGTLFGSIAIMADALNNSFAMVIQSFIQIVGTLTLLYVLNWRLSLIVTVCYGIMFWYIKFSGKRSKGYYTKQQNSLGELNGYIEELITGGVPPRRRELYGILQKE